MEKCQWKRSEIIFVKDDVCHNYCIHQDMEDDFDTWNDLTTKYWDMMPDCKLEEFYAQHGYSGQQFDDYMIGMHPNAWIKETEFQPE